MNSDSWPFISVVLCVYNEEKYLRSCLDAILRQTYPNECYDILIIENESADRTQDIADEFIRSMPEDAPHTNMLCIKHVNLSVSRNVGISNTSSEVIAYIDGDAIPEDTWLENLAKPFVEGADYVGGRINLLNRDSWIARFIQHTKYRQFFGPKLFSGQFVGCNMAFRRTIFEQVVGFQENFYSLGDESTLLTRLGSHFKYRPAPDAVVLHERPETVSAIVRTQWKGSTLSYLTLKASGKIIHWKQLLCILEQGLMTIFPVVLCLIWINPVFFGLASILSILAIMRRLFFHPLSIAIVKGLVKEYGFMLGVAGHVLFYYTQNVLIFLGHVYSISLYRDIVIIPPMATEVIYLKSIDSKVS